MFLVPQTISEDELFDIVHTWLEHLEAGDYSEAAKMLNYGAGDVYSTEANISNSIARFTQEGVTIQGQENKVTDWRKAVPIDGQFKHERDVAWYEPNDTRLRGAIGFSIPINGYWSEMVANFVWFDGDSRDDAWLFVLEDFYIPS